MKIILIRHLPTPGNEKRQYIGSTDEELSVHIVEAFRQRMAECPDLYPPVQRVISSPMKRCVQTAHLIWPEQEISTEEMLRECDFGEYEGKTYEELKDRPEYIQWMESGGTTAFPGGEEQSGFRRRCREGVAKWVRLLISEDVESAAFVVHGGTIMAALSGLAEDGREFYDWQAANGCGYLADAPEQEWLSGVPVLRNVRRTGMRFPE